MVLMLILDHPTAFISGQKQKKMKEMLFQVTHSHALCWYRLKIGLGDKFIMKTNESNT